jgi:hypothetical protein
MTKRTHTRAAKVATLVLVLGVLASLAGNLQAIYLDNARPGIGAVISAMVWPLAVLGMVELLLHTPWLANWRDHLTKLATVLLVAAVATWVSYWHLANVLSHYGYDVASRYAGPLAIDAAMVLAALALNRIGLARRAPVVSDMALPIGVHADGTPATMDMSTAWESIRHAQLANDTTDAMPLNTLSTELGSMYPAADRAIQDAGAEPAAETENWLDALAGRVPLDDPVLPAPVTVIPGPRTPLPRRAPGRTRTEIDPAEASLFAMAGRAEGHYSAGEIAELLAGWYGVSTRTIRRQEWWKVAMQGDASEGANAS